MMKVPLLLLSSILIALVSSSRTRVKRPVAPPDGEIYAILVAGSNGWYNYRHQADVAHSYHVLLDHGFPKENIIVMMYDDIANNAMNPFKGKLFNAPHGKDVYSGLQIDYKGRSVTSQNFVNILKGNSSGITGGNGRILDSTKNDRIFVYFTDHGATGLISFPEDILTVKQLINTLNWMYKNEKYSQLVFYLEACESGSMFEKVLSETINVYAITAANGRESSWGTYCENDMGLPCLGDLFSVNWMDDSDVEDLNVETLNDQFLLVKQRTNKSHVQHFGDLNIAKEPVGWFQGEQKGFTTIHKAKKIGVDSSVGTWPSRDIEIMGLHQEKQRAQSHFEQKFITTKIEKLHEERRHTKMLIHTIVERLFVSHVERRRMFDERSPVSDMECHDEVISTFDRICIDFNENSYAMKYAYVLNNMCDVMDTYEIIEGLIEVCIVQAMKNSQ